MPTLPSHAVFDRLDTHDGLALTGGAAPASLAAEMHGAWVAFCRDGDPGDTGLDHPAATAEEPRARLAASLLTGVAGRASDLPLQLGPEPACLGDDGHVPDTDLDGHADSPLTG